MPRAFFQPNKPSNWPDTEQPNRFSEPSLFVFGIAGKSAMAKPASSIHLSPDELKKLAETQIAQAMQIEAGPERLRVLTVADALINLAEIKKLMLEYERRLLN